MALLKSCPWSIRFLALVALIGPSSISCFSEGSWRTHVLIVVLLTIPTLGICLALSVHMGRRWAENLLAVRTRGRMVRDLGFVGIDQQGLFARRRSWPDTRAAIRIHPSSGWNAIVLMLAGNALAIPQTPCWMPQDTMHVQMEHRARLRITRLRRARA